jgi:hypothetical protein
MPKFENINYNDADRLAVLENLAAEFERRLLTVMHPEGGGYPNVAVPYAVPESDETDEGGESGEGEAGAFKGGGSWGRASGSGVGSGVRTRPGVRSGSGAPAAGGRTEALINRGRPGYRRPRHRRLLAHWRLLAAGAVTLLAVAVATLVETRGSGAAWPASVATVQAEIERACANPDVAAEPSGLNFACAKDTDQVLWVVALLTSGDNPKFVDQSTGRAGLDPVQPEQGGDIAWSLNLHHPYDPASPVDSLAVAARAINNIISGATLTSSTGSAMVEPGLESKAANCQRYTGSAKLATRPGYPAACASPVTSASGQAALVSDVFRQWMGGAPSRIAGEAGVLFENAGDPGNPQVQAILARLPASGG